jgi:hypothetical protein
MRALLGLVFGLCKCDTAGVRLKSLAALGAISLSVAAVANAGAATGTVALVEVNSTFGGVFVELNISPTFYYETSCPVPGLAFLPSSDPLYSTFLATILSAQASGTTITVSTSGCVAIPGSQQARISDIQLGTRLPGT